MEFRGISWIFQDFRGLSWIIVDYRGLSWIVGDLNIYHVDSLMCGCTLMFVVCCIVLSYAALCYLICANVDFCGLS